jgi:hypothetical protein
MSNLSRIHLATAMVIALVVPMHDAAAESPVVGQGAEPGSESAILGSSGSPSVVRILSGEPEILTKI